MFRPFLAVGISWLALAAGEARAADYFLTIGGGYNPAGNQASLEANVLFFQRVLDERHTGSRVESVFFADGFDDEPDLQILKPSASPEGPLTRLLSRLHSRGATEVTYRNHNIRTITGPISPGPIERNLRSNAARMRAGDRLIIYATAHGEEAKGDNEFNTTISCWDDQRISAGEFSEWLDAIPREVPVILVMAQCYCGGFAHTLFNQADVNQGLSERLRCGFFAQQHDLPAAGCRPDIENDEEYSSFFWGAFLGRTRNGNPLIDIDCDGDGSISFAEAHAQAVLVSSTIDIPLRTSEILLRQFSYIEGYEHRGRPETSGDESSLAIKHHHAFGMMGSLRSICAGARPDMHHTVAQLCRQLDIEFDGDVTQVFEQYTRRHEEFLAARRNASRVRRRRGPARRDLREEIRNQWPELADRRRWRDSELLAEEKQGELIEMISQLPSYQRAMESFEQREENSRRAEAAEIRDVKFQRLINTLEIIMLARNLHLVASPEIVDRYAAVLALEESTLSPRPN